MKTEDKREKEKRIVEDMIRLYCKKNHHVKKGELCPECSELLRYAKERSDKCPFMETKTFCVNCKVHCYKKDKREQIRQVMKFSGPRMIFYHPVTAISHVISVQKEKKKLNKEK